MKREDILKEADWHYGNICLYNEDGHPEIYKDGFVDGADWRINSVWHDASEKPKLGELIIVEVYGKIWDYGKYDICDTIHPKAQWAYMKDLIPTKD